MSITVTLAFLDYAREIIYEVFGKDPDKEAKAIMLRSYDAYSAP